MIYKTILLIVTTDLERFYEGPQKVAYSLWAVEQFHEAHDPKKSEKGDWYADILRRLDGGNWSL